MTMLPDRRRQQAFQAKQQEHYKEEPFTWNGYGGEITAWPCGCGQSFTEESEQERHVAENKEEQ